MYILTMIFLYANRKAYMASNFNCRIETDGFLVTGMQSVA